ncbi:MAG: class II aldolase/adducin family protein [Rhodospirillaceae bacterium]|jgi:ribulose-5-phosphate 4-epimerase/fuculose-1-phosphate aldolase
MEAAARQADNEVRARVSPAEWALREDLAACYRLVYRYGWDDGIFTHNSARVPGAEEHFLINPYGFMFREITASSLIKIDMDGNIVDGGALGRDADIIDAGYTIHSAVHMARHDARCVMHTHTVAGMAVSAQKDGLLPLAQTSMRFYKRVAYHDFEGIADDLDERDRLVADLGTHHSMILRNHGLLTVGRSVAEAFSLMRYLQRACELQIAAQAGGELTMPSEDVCEKTAQQFDRMGDNQRSIESSWAALRRMLDAEDPSYRH